MEEVIKSYPMESLLIVMILAGLLGGAINHVLSQESNNTPFKSILGRSLLVGLGASFSVPLFLNMISSELVSLLPTKPEKLYIFAGFCLIAAISSRAFLKTLSDKLLKEVQANKKETEAIKEQLKDKTVKFDELEHELQQTKGEAKDARLLAAIAEDNSKVNLPNLSSLIPEIATTIQPGPYDNDPWKGVFGGKSIDKEKGRVLDAQVEPLTSSPGWYSVTLTIKNIDAAPPVEGDVQFFIHDTFPNPKPLIKAVNGSAVLRVKAWGAFTAGVLADNGETRLELDLADLETAPMDFRMR